MAKRKVEKPICEACGADVRDGSLYCYNCGGPVAPEAVLAASQAPKKAVSDAWFKDDIIVQTRETTKLAAETVTAGDAQAADPPAAKTGIYEEAKLRTAASLRRKGKSIERRSVEVVWEEPQAAPGARFILAALSLTLLVIVIFFAAEYLK